MSHEGRCAALCLVRSDSNQKFYAQCSKQSEHRQSHQAVLRTDRGFSWRLSWDGDMGGQQGGEGTYIEGGAA